MNYENLAIGDMLRHPVFGVVTYSPDLSKKISNDIIVRTSLGNIAEVKASDCEPADSEDIKSIKKRSKL